MVRGTPSSQKITLPNESEIVVAGNEPAWPKRKGERLL